MAHKVRFSLPERELGKADIVLGVERDGARIGTLKVSKGSVVWVRAGAKYGYKMYWDAFDALMQEHGTHERGRK